MASSKKRKIEQNSDDLTHSNTDHDTKFHHSGVAYVRQPDDASGGGAATDSDADHEDEGEDVRELLEPLSTDQLTSLLVSAAARDPSTLAEIQSLADVDPTHRKLFVHGLDWSTTSDSLRAAFTRYGEIDDCRVVVDRPSGRSRGYGFVLFRRRSSARGALRNPQKLIDSRTASCQLASTGPTGSNPNPYPNPNTSSNHNLTRNPADNLTRKIYVGNVHSDIDSRRLYDFFSQYGEIEEGPIGFDRLTGKPKGFALFVYNTVEGARKALEEPSKNFEGHLLVCQRATDSNKARASAAGGSAGTAPNFPSSMVGFNGMGFAGQVAQPEMGLVQQAAMLGQGFLGQGMAPNAAVLAMLAATGQNSAAFGINPAMLASLNPALAGTLAAGASPAGLAQAAMAQHGTVPIQGYGMGSSGYQNVGFQGTLGFQGALGLQGTPPPVGRQQVGSSNGTYQGGNMGQVAMQRHSMGPMSGYGSH